MPGLRTATTNVYASEKKNKKKLNGSFLADEYMALDWGGLK